MKSIFEDKYLEVPDENDVLKFDDSGKSDFDQIRFGLGRFQVPESLILPKF